ncbi:hypothetical protein GPECTOR_3g434 [Gonium pectorale]|uniref:Uncharacterized protein n=1 Tax=Gonium pectorale TaxID=33097 RepID=A0A150GZL1_GONPE|nr:hypothetical protein GPECTOR_3g434 [Gonium pectorale]|eukprot:KXZ55299.1 hypothetical protein GPECTOR_3g434 [Gonium pectorale]
MCHLSLNFSLSEAGTAFIALQIAGPSAMNFTSAGLSAMNLTAPPAGVLRVGSMYFNASGSETLLLSALASGRNYSLSAVAADSSGNLQPRPTVLTQLTAPDITPPLFLSYSAGGVADTAVAVNVSLNERSVIMWTVLPSGFPAPNASAVVIAAANTSSTLAGTLSYAPSAGPGALTTWQANGLKPGQVYDIHMVARDINGNQQAAVTTIAAVRTYDSSPPAILNLTATVAATGNRFTIAANTTKPGTLYYMAVRSGAPVPTTQQLLQPSSYPAGAANFSGRFSLNAALAGASVTLCVAGGSSYQIWAVAEDLEGTFPNRQPNYSNVARPLPAQVQVVLQTPVLYLEATSPAAASASATDPGRVLRFAFQLRDVMTGFSLQFGYNSSRMTFLRAAGSGLWSDLVVFPLPVTGGSAATGGMALWATALTRTSVDAMYQGRTVPLLDAYFQLADTELANGTQLAVLSAAGTNTLYPYAGSPPVFFSDFRTLASGSVVGTSGSVLLVSPRQLAVFAHVASHDVFNTAVLDGKSVSMPVQAVTVLDWAAGEAQSGALVTANISACTCNLPKGLASALSISNCRMALTASHSQPSKLVNVSITCSGDGGTGAALQAQTFVTVWYPVAFKAQASDPDGVLSSVLPVNVPPPAAGSCADRYQSTQLYLMANWSNNGTTAADTLADVDVTSLVSNWTVDSPQALRVVGSTARGMVPHAGVTVTALGAGGRALATTTLAVSDQPVCVDSLDAVAVSNVAISGQGQPGSAGRWRVSFKAEQNLNWELATARVSVLAVFSDGAVMPVSPAAATTAVVPSTASNGFTYSPNLPFSLQQAASGSSAQDLQVNVSFGTATCGSFLKTSWSVCSSSVGAGLAVAAGLGTVRVVLPAPTRIALFLVSSPFIASASNGAAQPPISVPTRSILSVLVAFDDGKVHDMTGDPRVTLIVTQGADLCSIAQDADTGLPYVAATGGALVGGACSLEARASFNGIAGQLAATNTTTVVTLTALQVYVAGGRQALPPVTNSSSLTGLASPDVPLRLFKCDFSHYLPASIWAMGRLSNCGASCVMADLNNPASTTLVLADSGAMSLSPNPANTSLSNVIQPIRPGSTKLTISFSGLASASFNVSVEDTFQAGWPKIVGINDTGFTIVANMTSAAFKVTYLVKRIAGQQDAAAAAPSAAEVERAGVALSPGDGNPTLLSDTLSDLLPASNYTAFLAVRFQSQLLSTVVAITSVLTPDNSAPTFASIGAIQNMTTDAQRFTMRLPVTVSEAGTISYAIYRNSSCIAGLDQVPVSRVLNGSALLGTVCSCSDLAACQPVAWGNVSLSADQLNNTLTLSGLLPPNPYSALSGASQDQLTCAAASLPAPASASHVLYMVAQDDLPTYRGWNVTCNPPASSPGTGCGATAPVPCTACPAGPY